MGTSLPSPAEKRARADYPRGLLWQACFTLALRCLCHQAATNQAGHAEDSRSKQNQAAGLWRRSGSCQRKRSLQHRRCPGYLGIIQREGQRARRIRDREAASRKTSSHAQRSGDSRSRSTLIHHQIAAEIQKKTVIMLKRIFRIVGKRRCSSELEKVVVDAVTSRSTAAEEREAIATRG